MEKTPKQIRNEKLAAKVLKGLEKRHFEGHYCETREEAVKLALSLIPVKSSVTWGGSDTIRSIGLTAAVHEGDYEVWDRDRAQTKEEQAAIYRKAFSADVYLTGTNAISEDGVLVNIDGTGNRVAAMTFGPGKVIVLAGINKVAKTVEDAATRARTVAAPVNAQRFEGIKTGCMASGSCEDCLSTDSICAYASLIRLSRPAGRIAVILIGEELGY
ncbi:MAG: lactate utilization protein [Lachnospiraceae bacterium]|nr:lactate utilization protein [Lachnospiraceae bacterium]